MKFLKRATSIFKIFKFNLQIVSLLSIRCSFNAALIGSVQQVPLKKLTLLGRLVIARLLRLNIPLLRSCTLDVPLIPSLRQVPLKKITLLACLVPDRLLCLNIPFGVLKTLLLLSSTISKVLYLRAYKI